jgi:excinuclease ABC subunit C
LFHIEKCSGPCVGAVEKDAYREHVEQLIRFLNGNGEDVRSRLEREMTEASSNQDYERAAVLRDRLGAVAKVLEKQQMVAGSDEDFDLVGVVEDELQAAVQLFHVRHGRVVGRNAHIVDKVEDTTTAGLMERVVEGLYEDDPALGIPPLILTSDEPSQVAELAAWLSSRAGRVVEVRVPSRGAKRDLLHTVKVNAKEDLQRTRLKRSSDHNARSKSLLELRDALELPYAPLRIECFDMAHLQGTDYVGSMVVLEDGLPNRREYRRFKVKNVPGNDDYAAMREVLTRRFSAYVAEREEVNDNKRRKFGYPPQLLLVDGGKGQLNVAVQVLEELGLESEIPVAALAKEFEEVFVPTKSESIRIPRSSEALYMLQVVRDEAHRFANTFHRELRQKRMTRGALDGIEGLGERRRKRLVESLGGVRGVKAASLEDLLALTWLPEDIARAVYEHLHH